MCVCVEVYACVHVRAVLWARTLWIPREHSHRDMSTVKATQTHTTQTHTQKNKHTQKTNKSTNTDMQTKTQTHAHTHKHAQAETRYETAGDLHR